MRRAAPRGARLRIGGRRSAWRSLGKLLRNPGKYVPLGLKLFQLRASVLFTGTACHMQEQMVINPRSICYTTEFVEATGGYFPAGDAANRKVLELEPWDTTRRDLLVLFLRTVIASGVPGDFAELGVYRGATARLIHHYAPERPLHLFDTFSGFTAQDLAAERSATGLVPSEDSFSDTSVDTVRCVIGARSDKVQFHPGPFPASIPRELEGAVFAFVHLDADIYEPTRQGLEFFYPRLAGGGILVVHDYNAWPGARRAVDEYFAHEVAVPIPMPDKSGSALVVKPREEPRGRRLA